MSGIPYCNNVLIFVYPDRAALPARSTDGKTIGLATSKKQSVTILKRKCKCHQYLYFTSAPIPHLPLISGQSMQVCILKLGKLYRYLRAVGSDRGIP